MKLTEKLSYLQGLIDGLEIDESTKEGKVFSKITDILEELAEAVEGIQDEVSEMTELVDIIDQELGDVEEALLDEDDDDDDDDTRTTKKKSKSSRKGLAAYGLTVDDLFPQQGQ